MTKLLALVAVLDACTVERAVVNESKQVAGDLGSELEFACGVVGWTCGQVFQCDVIAQDGTPSTDEWCWMDDSLPEFTSAVLQDYAEATCRPTPRGGGLGWPCIYCCGAHCPRGANAYMGSYCP